MGVSQTQTFWFTVKATKSAYSLTKQTLDMNVSQYQENKSSSYTTPEGKVIAYNIVYTKTLRLQ